MVQKCQKPADIICEQSQSTQLLKKLKEFSTGFLRLVKVFCVYAFKIRLPCVQNVVHAMLAAL